MDTFARALLSTPRDIQTTGGLEWVGKQHRRKIWKAGEKREIVCCVILCRSLNPNPVPWDDIQRWASVRYDWYCQGKKMASVVCDWVRKERL